MINNTNIQLVCNTLIYKNRNKDKSTQHKRQLLATAIEAHNIVSG